MDQELTVTGAITEPKKAKSLLERISGRNKGFDKVMKFYLQFQTLLDNAIDVAMSSYLHKKKIPHEGCLGETL